MCNVKVLAKCLCRPILFLYTIALLHCSVESVDTLFDSLWSSVGVKISKRIPLYTCHSLPIFSLVFRIFTFPGLLHPTQVLVLCHICRTMQKYSLLDGCSLVSFDYPWSCSSPSDALCTSVSSTSSIFDLFFVTGTLLKIAKHFCSDSFLGRAYTVCPNVMICYRNV